MASRRKRPHRTGPPLMLATPDTRTRLVDAVRAGTPLTQAAIYAGVGERTLFRTLARGEHASDLADRGLPLDDDDRVALEVWTEVRRARADVAVRNVGLIQREAVGGQVLETTTRTFTDEAGRTVREVTEKRARGDWRAAKWLLETSFQHDFAKAPQHLQIGLGADAGAPAGEPRVAEPAVQDLVGRLQAFVAQRQLEPAEADDFDGDVVEGEIVA